jgi:hypothetical protein
MAGAIYECSDPERISVFQHHFRSGISAPVRTPRGRDIMAACGQLEILQRKKSRAELDRLAEEKQAALGVSMAAQGAEVNGGVFARHNRLPFAIDIIHGLLFYLSQSSPICGLRRFAA